STARQLMPLCLGTPASVRTSSRHQSATCALLDQTFCPLTTHSSPSRSARQRSAARSEPAPGSEKPRHQTSSAGRIGGNMQARSSVRNVSSSLTTTGGLLQRPAARQTGGSGSCAHATTRRLMDFSFTDAELAFAAEARAWLDAHLPPAWRRDHCWTRADDPAWLEIARDWQRMLFEGGWAAIAWPRAHGGRGATVIERWLFDQELDHAGAPRPAAACTVDLIGPAILQHGSTEQRDRFLRPLLSGRELWCQGFSEPGAGSDLAALRPRGARHGGGVVVSGQKVRTSPADIADRCLLRCRADPDAP